MRWFRKHRDTHLEIPIGDRIVRITLTDGGVGYEDPDGETYWDGWATVDDLAWELGEHSKLLPDQARVVAEEAVRRWREALGPGHRPRYFKPT